MLARGQDLAGLRFGRWTVSGLHEKTGYKRTYLCVCDCGNSKVVDRYALTSNVSKSCGCLRTETIATASLTHGKSRTPEYKVYISMLNRCNNPKYKEYHLYGGRGIKVAERWLKFENFIEDVGPRPAKGYQLDRKDNNKGYEPGNARWATRTENARNKRNTVFVEFRGRQTTLKEVAEELGVAYSALFYRYQTGLTGEALFAKSGTLPRRKFTNLEFEEVPFKA